MDLIDKYLGEAMTKDQYKEMLINTQTVAQKAEKDYKRFVSLMKKKNIMDYATEIQRLVKGFQAITYGTIFDYPLRQGGFGDYLANVSSASLATKEIKNMQTRIANFEKWRKTSPTQRKMFEADIKKLMKRKETCPVCGKKNASVKHIDKCLKKSGEYNW